jgi:hypothetical protein
VTRTTGSSLRRGSTYRRRALGFACAVLVALLCAAPAAANHSLIDLISTGPDAGGFSYSVAPVLTSADGGRVFFLTTDRLVGADADSAMDVYERSGGVTTLISTGPLVGTQSFYPGEYPNGGESLDATLLAVSSDGSRVTFSTAERLTGDDQDNESDIYQRAGGTTTLISTGADNRLGITVALAGASADGAHVVFQTIGRFASADTDTRNDLYDRFGGTTSLVSTGPTDDGDAAVELLPYSVGSPISTDGTHIFFFTNEKLAPEDLDTGGDIYERVGGVTKLISTGPTDSATGSSDTAFQTSFDHSADGTHVIFDSNDKLVPEDLDTKADVYERVGNTTTLVSTGPTDTHSWPICVPPPASPVCHPRISADGTHIFFVTNESLTSEDTGGYADLYDRSGSTVKLVSIGPSGGNGPVHVGTNPLALSDDGSHVFFTTTESLVPSDTDTAQDIYERSGGTTTTLASTGPIDTDPTQVVPFGSAFASNDGARLFWGSNANLVPEDTNNNSADLYERYAGTTTFIGATAFDVFAEPNKLVGISPDGTHVFMNTGQTLTPDDTDGCLSCYDIYDRHVAGASALSEPSVSRSWLPNYGAEIAGGGHSALP